MLESIRICACQHTQSLLRVCVECVGRVHHLHLYDMYINTRTNVTYATNYVHGTHFRQRCCRSFSAAFAVRLCVPR